ncbi:hypothetical protein GM418_30800 [Maribellus comscasis]|uniref:Uncharacterized protein n=1 Tax=Maribellus comscasis TaxID=2681766 RepID=A0A6I6K346_9BACT|nr:hypothetical protein [Maribellus comscasis]QGY47888.1 hypothetical protein GM418_30800 [Maribellus comscasis]
MELADIQNTWKEHDKMLMENIRINKEIFKNILTERAEKKIRWMKAKTIFSLILPPIFLIIFFISKLEYRPDTNFIVGAILFGTVFITSYIWTVQYFIKLSEIDFKKAITTTTKNLTELKKYKFRNTKLGYMLIPFAMIGIFMVFEIPFFSRNSILPIFLIFATMIVSIYVNFKFSINESFKRINQEIIEIEKLEKE